MKKTGLTLATLTLGSALLATASTQVSAADKLDGSTEAKSAVTKGDLLFTAPAAFDFGSQALSNDEIKFEQKVDAAGKVTDYTGDNTGYAIDAKVSSLDEKGELKVNGITLNATGSSILKVADTTDAGKADGDAKTDKFGDNAFNPKFDLSYKGLDHLIAGDKATITWTLSKTDISGITE